MNRKGNRLQVAIEDLSTNERIAWGHRLAGRNGREAADAMGCSVQQVRAFWRNARMRRASSKGGRLDLRISHAGRCERCHLLKPCVCLPTIQELATSRRGESSCVGPAHASHSGNATSGSRMP